MVFATKNGNWSNPTVWNTGMLPESGDEVSDGGWTVTIDQDIDLGTGYLNAVSGGRFQVVSAGITITCDHIRGSTNPSLRLTHPSGYVYINGDIVGGYVASRVCVGLGAAGGLEVVGNVYGGHAKGNIGIGIDGYDSYTTYGIKITGNVYAGTANNSPGLYANGRPLEIIGNIYGGDTLIGLNQSAYAVLSPDSQNIRITGDIIGYGPQIAASFGSSDIIIDGNVRLIEAEEYAYRYPALNPGAPPGTPIFVTGEVIDGQFGTPAIGPIVVRGVLPSQVDLLHGDTEDYSIASYYPRSLEDCVELLPLRLRRIVECWLQRCQR